MNSSNLNLTKPAAGPRDRPLRFRVTSSTSEPGIRARVGILDLPHASVETPVFMPVGTQATVKGLTHAELNAIGYRIILGNAYHLHLRPGDGLIARAGGLHRFQGWNGALLTDSGGFQVFSLTGLRRIGAEGVEFQSYIDGSKHHFTSESVMEIERNLGADIIMAFDECAPIPCPESYAREAMERTHAWAARCVAAYDASGRRATGGWPQALFGIVQGGIFRHLREESVHVLTEMNLPGYAVGGLAVGEAKEQRNEAIVWCTELLPSDKPRYLMGVGTPEDILDSVERGVDMFDCVMPTRNARNAQVFTSEGSLNLMNARFTDDFGPIDPACSCAACAQYSRAYVRHLFKAKEILASRITTYHNLSYYYTLMADIRAAIKNGVFRQFKADFLSRLAAGAITEA